MTEAQLNHQIDLLERRAMAEEERRLTDAERDQRRDQWLRRNPDTLGAVMYFESL